MEIFIISKLILFSIDSGYDKELMLEMDRFVFSLSGDDKEVIERRSLDSAAAMKEQGLTLKRFMQDIIDNRETSTWCGFPQNLLVPRFHCQIISRNTNEILPRSKRFIEGDQVSDAQSFILFAFVNDLENQDVDEGSDGVEHM